MDWFENWFDSPYYKILYQNRDELEAQEFVEELLAYLQPQPGCRMLDIACGSGRFARQLAEHGYEVTGIDISRASITAAKAFEDDHLHFFVHDMRLPFYTNYFDLAFNFFTSFGYFAHDRDHILAAKTFAGALRPGGLLVIDYLNPEFVHANLVPEETINRGNYNFHIVRSFVRNHFIKDIRFQDADGKPKHYTESVAAFSLADFTHMFRTAGMSLVGTFGNYMLDSYHPADSPRLIMIFKKKNG
ncbi:class I SAM-dependent methyltransferase [Nemorincola caseinilytica]|uniref:Class I SAM-dependent methyltransferase n=1 Tax=Nemorincola caseinilytica TaxID=2054315 RepID=A0ABP8NN15_9BACT